MKNVLSILVICLSITLLKADAPAVLEYSTRADGWSYPDGGTTTTALLQAFKVSKDTVIYVNNVVTPNINNSDLIERFKFDSSGRNFTVVILRSKPK